MVCTISNVPGLVAVQLHDEGWSYAPPVTPAEPFNLDLLSASPRGGGDVVALLQRVCAWVQETMGFERVVVYRFDTDMHSEGKPTQQKE